MVEKKKKIPKNSVFQEQRKDEKKIDSTLKIIKELGVETRFKEIKSEKKKETSENIDNNLEKIAESSLENFSSGERTAPTLPTTNVPQAAPIERQLENVPRENQNNEEPRVYNAPVYSAGYEPRRERPTNMEAPGPTLRRIEDNSTDFRRIDPGITQREMLGRTGMNQEEREYVSRVERLNEGDNLPFEQRERRKRVI